MEGGRNGGKGRYIRPVLGVSNRMSERRLLVEECVMRRGGMVP